MEWTNETIARLRAMWDEGHSTAEIGRRLSVSKNAVVGKAHRLDLPARPSPIRRDGSADAPRIRSPRRIEGPTLPPLVSAHAAGPAPRAAALQARPAAASLAAPPPGAAPLAGPPLAAAPLAPAPLAPAPLDPLRPVPVAPAPRVQVAPRPFARTVACCWPIGEPGTKSFRFCDGDALMGKPYCQDHAQLAYVKVRDRREDAA